MPEPNSKVTIEEGVIVASGSVFNFSDLKQVIIKSGNVFHPMSKINIIGDRPNRVAIIGENNNFEEGCCVTINLSWLDSEDEQIGKPFHDFDAALID